MCISHWVTWVIVYFLSSRCFCWYNYRDLSVLYIYSSSICFFLRIIIPLWYAIIINLICVFHFREKSQRIYRLGLRTTLVMVLAITCWVLDKFFCDTYLGQKFPYLHAIWHILIFISSYTACVLFAYYAVKEEYVNHIPDLRYWPVNEFELGIPFVSIKCYYSEEKRNI